MHELYYWCKELELLRADPHDQLTTSVAFSNLSDRFLEFLGSSDLQVSGESIFLQGVDRHRLGHFSVEDTADQLSSRYSLSVQAYAQCDPFPAHLRLSVGIHDKNSLPDLIAFECAARQSISCLSQAELKLLFEDSFGQPFEVDAYTIDEIGPLISHDAKELRDAVGLMSAYTLEVIKEEESTGQRVRRRGGVASGAILTGVGGKDEPRLSLDGLSGVGGVDDANGAVAGPSVGDRPTSARDGERCRFQPMTISRNLSLPLDNDVLELNLKFFASIKQLLWASVNVVPKAMQRWAL